MARILFTVLPLTGHLNPALSLAGELAAEGHEVAFAVHREALGSRMPPGIRVYPLDAEHRPPALGEQARGLESVRLFFEDYMLPLTRQALAPLEAAARDFRPDVMAVDHQMLAGALVARKLGLPWVSLVTTSASIIRLSPVLDAWVAEQYLALQQDCLPPDLVVERPDFSPHAVIVFSIEALMGTARDRIEAPYVFVGPASRPVRPAVAFPWPWLRDDRRLVLVTMGTVSRDRDHRFFEVMMEAFAQLPEVQAVLVAPPSLARKAPDNVLVRDYVPQLDLLNRAAGVICHAGHNTVCEALLRERPLVVAPIRDDQPVIARQVIEAGAGVFMRYGKVTPAAALAAITRLLDDAELAANARRLSRALLAAPGIRGAAGIVSGLAGRGAPCR
ncbi:MAG: nucleotide disphospho-sugar-binding domain-containing protein [Rhizobiaceae bacterium]